MAAKKFAITSNVDPRIWWPEACQIHRDAVSRRLSMVEHYVIPYLPLPRGTPRFDHHNLERLPDIQNIWSDDEGFLNFE